MEAWRFPLAPSYKREECMMEVPTTLDRAEEVVRALQQRPRGEKLPPGVACELFVTDLARLLNGHSGDGSELTICAHRERRLRIPESSASARIATFGAPGPFTNPSRSWSRMDTSFPSVVVGLQQFGAVHQPTRLPGI